MAGKDAFLAVLAGEKTDRFVHPDDFVMLMLPGEHNDGGELQSDGSLIGTDWFGSSWTQPAGASPIIGPTITPGTRRLQELSDFSQVIPTAEQVRAFDWAGYAEQILSGVDRQRQVVCLRSFVGPFERMHSLIGFEDALCAFYDEPETVEAFFAAVGEFYG